MNELALKVPHSNQVLVICDAALEVFVNARQISSSAKETGGLLFAEISTAAVRIVKATRAEKRASVSRFTFVPTLRAKRSAIKREFRSGLHFVGEWHTHPERDPTPSSLDNFSMQDSFVRSEHELDGFVMVVVGNRREALSVSVSLHAENENTSLGQHRVSLRLEEGISKKGQSDE